MDEVKIIGAGLAGSEAALQLSKRGIKAKLYEMRPKKTTGAHTSSYCAEFVCSNSLGSYDVTNASGLLKHEMECLGGELIKIAKENSVPAGNALAISREDFSAAVDYLSNNRNVNPDRIGILGICGFGGFAINAAAIDTRIKATTAITMYDMTRVSAKGYNDSVNVDARYEMKQNLNKQRTEDFKNSNYKGADGLPEKLTGNEPQFVQDYWGYYKTKRGFHSRSINSNGKWNMTSSLSLINQPILQYSNEIRTPVLIVHGENAHSRYFGEDAFKKLKGDNKELFIVKGANHVDLYDGGDKNAIPFDKIESFYKENLK